MEKKNFVNNKIFAISIIGYALYMPIFYITLSIGSGGGIYFFDILKYMGYICYIFIIPYFNNYYKLLKSENVNVSKKKTYIIGILISIVYIGNILPLIIFCFKN